MRLHPRWSRRPRPAAALAQALRELADAHAELARRQGFTDALLETIDVGIVSCDAQGVFVVSNRAERTMFGLDTGLEGLLPEHLPSLFEVFDADGVPLTSEQYPLMRTLRGEDVSCVDVLVGPARGPRRELVVRGSQIHGPDGQVLGAVAALSDVTVERAALRALAEERRKLAEAQLLGQLGGFEHDAATGAWTFSDQLCVLWGVAPDSVTGEELATLMFGGLIVEQDRRPAWQAWQASSRLAGHHSDEFRIRRADDGAERVIRSRIEVQVDADARPVRVRGTHLDITDLAAAQRSARRANAFSDAILAASPDDTLVIDLANNAIVYASPGKHLLGLTTEELEGLDAESITALIHPDDQQRLRAANTAALGLADGQPLEARYRARHADGRLLWLNHSITPFRRDGSGAVVEVLAVVRDVTDLVQAEELLTHAARHDNLTGLPNRAQLVDTLDAALARSRADGREVAVLFCDLDGFKRVNDTGGHSAGDAVLQETARRLLAVLREQDTVARVGGDEFVVVIEPSSRAGSPELPGARPPADESPRALAVQVAERVIEALRVPITFRGLDHVVTASIGITYATLAPAGRSGPVTVDEVLHQADAAMYRAKDRGKNRYEVLVAAPSNASISASPSSRSGVTVTPAAT